MVFYGLAVVLIGVALALAGAGFRRGSGLPRLPPISFWQIRRLEISDPALCLRIFKSNRDAGLLLFAGLLADAVMRGQYVRWGKGVLYAVPTISSVKSYIRVHMSNRNSSTQFRAMISRSP